MNCHVVCLCYRYNDIDIDVRRICVQTSMSFIVNHKDLVKDIAGKWVHIYSARLARV